MLESLLGNATIEKVLFYLLKNNRCYARQLSLNFDLPLYSFQKALQRLEKGRILASFKEGKTLIFQFNPQYPFLSDLRAFLVKAYSFLPDVMKETFYEKKERKRPRRSGKPL